MKKIDFEINTEYGLYRDALYVDESVSDEEIEAMKQERVNNWISIVTAPPVETLPSGLINIAIALYGNNYENNPEYIANKDKLLSAYSATAPSV